jgi:hypothetical protein
LSVAPSRNFIARKRRPPAAHNDKVKAELFDVLNRTNFWLPDSDISSPTFNHILEAESPRRVHFALKFLF